MHAWLSGVFLSVPDQGGWGLAMAIPKLACCAVFSGRWPSLLLCSPGFLFRNGWRWRWLERCLSVGLSVCLLW